MKKLLKIQYLPHNRSKKYAITSIRSYVHIESFQQYEEHAQVSFPEIMSSFFIEFLMTIFFKYLITLALHI
jgi:hypothetical protein